MKVRSHWVEPGPEAAVALQRCRSLAWEIAGEIMGREALQQGAEEAGPKVGATAPRSSAVNAQ